MSTCERCGGSIEAGVAHVCNASKERVTVDVRRTPRPASGQRPASATEAAPEPVASTPQPGALEVGRVLGGAYRIVKKIGEGGMGAVFLVEHIELNKRFAAKVMLQSKRVESMARFKQEAVAASRLDHENIVNIVNFGQDPDGVVFIVMELLKGTDLSHVVAHGAIPAVEAARLTIPICHGLGAAHAAGIVHRDMKPENVFLHRASRGIVVKLLDFGVSKIKDPTASEARLTQTGQVLGSPLYMSPEAARGDEEIDARADIYAIGVMLYEMVTGCAPFTGANYLRILQMHIGTRPKPPRDLVPSIPEAFEAVILKALAKEPDDRQQSVEELEGELRAALPGAELDGAIVLPATDFPELQTPSSSGLHSAPRPAGTPRPPSLGDPIPTPSAASRSQEVANLTSAERPRPPAATSSEAVGPTSPTATSRRGLVGIVVALAVVVFGLGAALVLGRGGDRAVSVRPGDAAPAPSPADAAAAVPAIVADGAPAAPPDVAVRIDSQPAEAAISIDGQAVGVTPFAGVLRPGRHQIRVTRKGFQPHEEWIEVEQGMDTVHITLARVRAAGTETPDTPGFKGSR